MRRRKAARMRAIVVLVVAVCALGCGSSAPAATSFLLTTDISGNPCSATEYVTGLLVNDATRGLVIRDDQGVVTHIVWRMSDSARQRPGGEIEVLDSRETVIATSGRRYRIGGYAPPAFEGAFWACAGVIIPL